MATRSEKQSQECPDKSRRSQPCSDPAKTAGQRQTKRVRGSLRTVAFVVSDPSDCHEPTLSIRHRTMLTESSPPLLQSLPASRYYRCYLDLDSHVLKRGC